MMIKPRIEIYENLVENYNKLNAWTDYRCFSAEDIEKYNLTERCAVVDIIYAGTQGDESVFDIINTHFSLFLTKLLGSMNEYSKLLFKIGEVGVKNRIRSYSRLFRGISDALEDEFDLKNGDSILAGIINVNENHFKNLDLFDS